MEQIRVRIMELTTAYTKRHYKCCFKKLLIIPITFTIKSRLLLKIFILSKKDMEKLKHS